MAGCSSSARITRFKDLQNDILFSSNKRQRVVIVHASNREVEPQPVVVMTTTTEARDGDCVVKDVRIGEKNNVSTPDGKLDGGGGDNNGGDNEEEVGVILKFEEVILEVEAQGISLPADMLEAARPWDSGKFFFLDIWTCRDQGGFSDS